MIRGLFEVAIPIRDLSPARKFFEDALGLRPALTDHERGWQFLWLQQIDSLESRSRIAFEVEERHLERMREALRLRGVVLEGPVRHDWMGGVSWYFRDPDDHDLEFVSRANHG